MRRFLAVLVLALSAGCSSYHYYTFTPDHESLKDKDPTKHIGCGEVNYEWSSGFLDTTHNNVGIAHYCPEPSGDRVVVKP